MHKKNLSSRAYYCYAFDSIKVIDDLIWCHIIAPTLNMSIKINKKWQNKAGIPLKLVEKGLGSVVPKTAVACIIELLLIIIISACRLSMPVDVFGERENYNVERSILWAFSSVVYSTSAISESQAGG